ncbi:LysR family transcriptional regulator [Companilactobacillus metriopterae]|uniref:LysR family transcriptional regulator n=1 Tax=Companilactobacillus metriopterae TaxID=1909267 RepID=UPI00100A46AC|nr:LysR family transcriptional regulator [Companilactobacillus metriopterae]
MEIRVLRYFLAVANEENISAAADLLHLSQPTLSRQLKNLEDELGVELFLRSNRQTTLTDEGIYLRDRAKEIVSLADQTEANISKNDGISGDIYIGAAETNIMTLIARVITEMRQEYPDLTFHLSSGNAEEVKQKMDTGTIDFGVIFNRSSKDKYNSIHLPGANRWGLIMRKDDPLTKKDFIESKDLLNLPLIISAQVDMKNSMSNWAGIDVEKLNIVATYNLIYNAGLLAKEGLGYIFGIDGLSENIDTSSLVFKPIIPFQEEGVSLIWKRDKQLSKAASKFLDELNIKINE